MAFSLDLEYRYNAKIKIFLWQMCHNALPVRTTLATRGCQVDPQCPLCMTDSETIGHLLRTCPMTTLVWNDARQHQWLSCLPPTTHTQEWLAEFLNFPQVYNKQMLQRITFLLWCIWKARNATVFKNEVFHQLRCLIQAKKLSAEWRIRSCMSVDDHFSGSFSTPNTPFKNHFKIIRWHPPIPGRTKLNFDGSLQGALAAGGFILRDWRGALLLAGASHYGNTSVAMAESRALWEGTQAALTAGYTSFDIAGDNALVIAAVKNDGGLPWRITTVISDI